MNERDSDDRLYLWEEEPFRALVTETRIQAGKAGVLAFHFLRYDEIRASKGPAIAEGTVPLLIDRLKNDSAMAVKMASVVALGQFGPDAKEALPPLREMSVGHIRGRRANSSGAR